MNARMDKLGMLVEILKILAVVIILAIILGLIAMALTGCTDANIHLPRKECRTYTLRDGRIVVVWIGDAPKGELPVVKDPDLPWPVDPKEFE